MAAAEYFTSGPRPSFEQQNSVLFPPPPFQRASSSQPSFSYHPAQQGHPSPQHTPQPSNYPPPPYQSLNNEPKPGVHFAASPVPGHRYSHSNQGRPEAYPLNQPNFQASQGQQLAPYPQGQYVPPGYYQPQSHSLPPPRPHHHHSHIESVRPGYASDPEGHRKKHKSRPRRTSDNSRSTNADGFIGAAGGGLIGDLIFPGLGTVGGALVGWVGGKDYGKHRKWREDKRDREQERWERKYGGSRSRSHSRDRTRHSNDERRHSHDRRKS